MAEVKIDLDAPAFGEGAQTIEEVAPVEVSEEIKPEVEVKEEKVVEESEEESKVPYSRFKKFHDEAVQLRKEKESGEWNKPEVNPLIPSESEDTPEAWLKLFGDSPEAKEAWKVQKGLNQGIKEEATKEAIRAFENRQNEELKRQEEGEAYLDESLEDVQAVAGRTLTEKEQVQVLDIMDEYTPKDDKGNYIGVPISPDKAWKIFEMQLQAENAPRKQSRDAVASLTGAQSNSEPSAVEEANKNFNPSWGSAGEAIRKRLGN